LPIVRRPANNNFGLATQEIDILGGHRLGSSSVKISVLRVINDPVFRRTFSLRGYVLRGSLLISWNESLEYILIVGVSALRGKL
jgi:hypothetical protein